MQEFLSFSIWDNQVVSPSHVAISWGGFCTLERGSQCVGFWKVSCGLEVVCDVGWELQCVFLVWDRFLKNFLKRGIRRFGVLDLVNWSDTPFVLVSLFLMWKRIEIDVKFPFLYSLCLCLDDVIVLIFLHLSLLFNNSDLTFFPPLSVFFLTVLRPCFSDFFFMLVRVHAVFLFISTLMVHNF